MKITSQTLLAALMLFTISCTKENSTILSTSITDESSAQALSSDANELAGAHAVRIGTQVWKIKNLTTSYYRNGDKIPQVKDSAKWAKLTTGAWCWYNNDSASGAVYGKLYNWYAVNDPRGLAPEGWHIPGDSEWTTLNTFLGKNAGGKMKETGTTHWFDPNILATNSSGFTGLPGGYRANDGPFYYTSFLGYWWSSTEHKTNVAIYRRLVCYSGFLDKGPLDKKNGFSVRCIKD